MSKCHGRVKGIDQRYLIKLITEQRLQSSHMSFVIKIQPTIKPSQCRVSADNKIVYIGDFIFTFSQKYSISHFHKNTVYNQAISVLI